MKNNISHAAGLILAFAVILCFIFTSTVLTAFEASASAPSITLEKESVGMGEEIVVRYNGTGGKDWIGIYPDGEVPGPKPSLRWCYAQNGSGTVSLIAQSAVDANKFLPAGKYQIYLLQNDGYTVLDRKELTVTYNANDYLPSISFGAGRTVLLTPAKKYDANVSYELYLGTASGKLPGYSSLATVTLKNNKYSHTVGTCTVIPSAATHLYAYLKTGDVETNYYASCKIPSSFYNTASFGSKLYEFQIFTDIHITDDNNYIHSQHFRLALRDVLRNSPNSKAIITIGDNTDNGRETQWQNLFAIKNSVLTNGKPKLYFTMGNHDRDYNGNFASQVALFKKYTGMPGVYYSFQIESGTFIVLGSESKGGFANLSNTQLNWLETQLKSAPPDKPVFLFLHEPLKDTVSGSLTSLQQTWYGVQQDAQLRKIVNPYPNVMFFTGHTHWHFNTTQPMLYGGGKTANYFNSASVGYLWNDEDREVTGSEGYYVEVYQNGIFVRGRDFANGLWTPATQYFVPLSAASSTPAPATPTKKPTGMPATPTPTPKPTQTRDTTGQTTDSASSGSPTAATADSAVTQTAATPTLTAGTPTPTSTAGTSPTPAGKTTPPASPAPGTDDGGTSALVIAAVLLSAAALGTAAAAGILLYKSRKGR